MWWPKKTHLCLYDYVLKEITEAKELSNGLTENGCRGNQIRLKFKHRGEQKKHTKEAKINIYCDK